MACILNLLLSSDLRGRLCLGCGYGKGLVIFIEMLSPGPRKHINLFLTLQNLLHQNLSLENNIIIFVCTSMLYYVFSKDKTALEGFGWG